ncbi:MAG: hypothetical protein GY811_10040 [Myxococcales bacterium]|nr:hypothetical protein [Myxococcales bacterium]
MSATTTTKKQTAETSQRFAEIVRQLGPEQLEFLSERIDVLIAGGEGKLAEWNIETRRLIAEQFGVTTKTDGAGS